jgi:Flp pilus assembly protein TadG
VAVARERALSRWLEVAKQSDGASAVEFALVLPVLLTILFSILKFGLTLNADLQLTDGVRAAARQFSLSRSSTTPYTLATAALQNATPNLTYSSIGGTSGVKSPTFTVNGTACSSDSGCATALSNAMGGTSKLTATYPCDLNIMGVNLAPNCTLTASTSDLVE